MSSYTTSISNLVKGAQSDALNEVLGLVRESFDETHLEQLTAAIEAYKAQHLTLETGKKGKGAKGAKGAESAAAADKPKRAFVPNGFTVFSKENRKAIVAANPGTATKDVMGLLGDAWKALSEQEQEVYKAKAKASVPEAPAPAAADASEPEAPAAAPAKAKAGKKAAAAKA